VLGPVGIMTPPQAIGSQDHADEFVDQLMDELVGGGTGPGGGNDEQGEEEAGDSNPPPNFWQGPINTGPVSFDKPVNDPVTSGSDGVVENGTVDNGPGNPQ
jgi:hypothetical protein